MVLSQQPCLWSPHRITAHHQGTASACTEAALPPQALNVASSVTFAALLGSAPLSLAVPAANGSSLLTNAACDWLLGEPMNLR